MLRQLKKAYTAAAASQNGYANNVSGASWALTANVPGDGLAHHVTVHNDSATDHSGKTITINGLDANGHSITETIAGPAGTSTVTSTKAFGTVNSITPSATIGVDTFDLGWAATGHTPWFDLDPRAPLSAAVYLASGSMNYDGQITYAEGATEDDVAINCANMTGKTATSDLQYPVPAFAFRVDINSHTSAVFTVYLLQPERTR